MALAYAPNAVAQAATAHMAMVYATNAHAATISPLALAVPEQAVATPSLSCLPDEDQAQLDKFATYQFGIPLAHGCKSAATVRLHHCWCTTDHAVPCTLVENCLMHGVSKALIKSMGVFISSDVVSQNEAN
jgi:hypothetical protein